MAIARPTASRQAAPGSGKTNAIHRLCTVQRHVATPLGRLLLARTAAGLAGLWFEGQKAHPGVLSAPEDADDAIFNAMEVQLAAYFAGEGAGFTAPLDLHGTPFQQAVWRVLLGIPAAQTRSYGQIAVAIGLPSAARAVGAAVGKNPVSIVVPCHRVVASQGALTGYAGGLERKRALLSLESRLRGPSSPAG